MRISEKQGLKSGQHIEILDVDDVLHGVVVKVEQMYPEDVRYIGENIAKYRLMRDTFMASIVTGWSYGDLPDVDPGEIRDARILRQLPRDAYRALHDATDEHYIDAGFIKGPAKKTESPGPPDPGK